MIEILESRIAPAAVFYFTDVDGDHVKISSSIGTSADLSAAGVVMLSNAAASTVGKPHQLESLNLGAAFAGATITITAIPSKDLGGTVNQGDGMVNVGLINAPTVDLKSVTIHGDLGQIIVGDSNTKTLGLGSLNVQSMGDFGLSTGANAPESRFENGVGSITVAHDVNGVMLHPIATGAAPTAKAGSIFIGGNLIAGTAADTGEISANDGIGSVKIMGNVIGGAFTDTGRIATAAGGNIGSISIGGDLVGGSAQATGVIYSPANITSVKIGHDILGGSAITTGGIDGGTIGTVTIGGDMRGGQFSSASAVDHSAFIRAQTNLKSVTITGSIYSGIETGGGALTFSGAIQAGQTLGAVNVLGSILGTSTNEVIISGAGLSLAALTSAKSDPAITSVSVKGSATYTQIEAGYDLNGIAFSGDAQIGAVSIGQDLIASDIIAGVKSTKGFFGDPSDTLIDRPANASTDGILASIASIVVGGQIEGTNANTNNFGIEAQFIGSIKTDGIVLPLTKGPGNDDFFLSATTGKDVHVRELTGT